LDPKKGLGEISTLYMADFFALHEYAGGNIDSYFTERHEDMSEIESGYL